jgi:hypothetical protein
MRRPLGLLGIEGGAIQVATAHVVLDAKHESSHYAGHEQAARGQARPRRRGAEVAGKPQRRVREETAVTPEFWLGIQSRFDVETARRTIDADIAAIKPRKTA